MTVIEPLLDADLNAVLAVTLLPEQVRFAGTPAEFVADKTAGVHPHVIRHNGTVVGFFKLDTLYADTHDFCRGQALGLRAFVVDSRLQGKGVGTRAILALVSYARRHYPDYRSLYLTVNCENPAAVHCYRKGGFIETGELYLGGSAGPQHIMRCDIAATKAAG